MRGILHRAIRELREETTVEADGTITWQRIETGVLHRKARARTIKRLIAMGALGLMMGGGALAASMYARTRPSALPRAGSTPSERSRPAGQPKTPAPTPSASPSPPRAPSAPSPRSSSIPVAREAPTIKVSSRSGARHSPPAAGAAATTGEDERARAPVDAATSTYAAAHQAHFIDRDWARALDLWNRYLALAPMGPLAPEAHFNRALCLLRQGRVHEAARELQPFAAGQWGGYRQGEAARLLEVMPQPRAP